MSVNVTEFNGIKSYNFSFDGSLPPSLVQQQQQQQKVSKGDVEALSGKNQISLIHNFAFPISSQYLKISPDQTHLFVSGVYKPSFKIFELDQLSLKVSRGIDSEIIKFLPLSSGYKKVAMICADRNIEFHAQYGHHFKIRTPKIGRDLCYVKNTADLVIAATGNELFRLNLEEGRFKSSWNLGALGDDNNISTFAGNYQRSSNQEDTEEGNFNMGSNCVGVGEQLGLVFTGCDDGRLRVFDSRQQAMVSDFMVDEGERIMSLNCDRTLEIVTGGSEGTVKIFDLRYSGATNVIRHPYMLPIHTIQYHALSKKLITADQRSVR